MTEQRLNQQNFNNHSSSEIPPAQKVYAFKDLPPDVQAKLLQMQNTDDEYLRLGSSVTGTRIVLLIFLPFGFAGFMNAVEDTASDWDWKMILIFAVGALIFTLCFLYLVWKLFKTMLSPVKNQIYLTPTQVIETTDGQVRFRQLKDAAEISVNGYGTDIGKRSSLDIKFADGDIFRYRLVARNKSANLDIIEKWRAQAQAWKDKALSASKRSDAAYFNSHDVFVNR